MNRRHVLTTIAGSATSIACIGPRLRVDDPPREVPDSFEATLDREIRLNTKSPPVVHDGSKFNLVSLGVCTLALDREGRLEARIRAAVIQYAHVDYWISLAVFDERHTFLGAAIHKETVEYIRLGAIPTVFRDLEFDFGMSRRFDSVTRLAVAISDRHVPKPD